MKHHIESFLASLIAAMSTVVMAESTNTITVTKFHQSYPYSGRATIEYTVDGALPANVVTEIALNTDDASAVFVRSNIVTGANSHVIDFASAFGGVLLLTNASFVVTIKEAELGGVQLWENGPYWAECNVGATKPEEYGYYFWWGDTVGYTYNGGIWISVKDGTNISFTDSGTAASTDGKTNAELLAEGYIDSTGNLTATHDAATVHLGLPWRMPTDAELSALVSNCTTTWITTNGVSGRLVTGKGTYATKSIFIPAAGTGTESDLDNTDYGYYWSSSPYSRNKYHAWRLFVGEADIGSWYDHRCGGFSIRPVRGFAQ
ncbi:MAG: hypothetical protein IJR99_03820 [Kiritimatiellae bacterium]|nr:hypothetical protein [Kiritimatiellia bacterium]